MDITKFIVSHRNEALLVGDHGTYRRQLSRRLLTLRRKLGRTTAKGKKYAPKAPLTTEDVAANPECGHLLLLTAERAWAHAMHIKAVRAADASGRGLAGAARTHIRSRLEKARKTAAHLEALLEPADADAGANADAGAQAQPAARPTDYLEAAAYARMLQGSGALEGCQWPACLAAYAQTFLVYTALARAADAGYAENFRSLLTSYVEPSLRYAAHQSQLPRTLSVARIAAMHLPAGAAIARFLPDPAAVLQDAPAADAPAAAGTKGPLPTSISWRARTVKLEDARITQALAGAYAAEATLSELFAERQEMSAKERAGAYDAVLGASQDAVDATRAAIAELAGDGVAIGDPRMQALQVTRTAVHYALIGWRVGRNRALCGPGDGALLEPAPATKKKRKGKPDTGRGKAPKAETKGSVLKRLRERVVLYDSTLQSLDAVAELPGVAGDRELAAELESKRAYFNALRCLAIARANITQNQPANALALLARAQDHAARATTPDADADADADADSADSRPLNLAVRATAIASLQRRLASLTQRQRALVELARRQAAATAAEAAAAPGRGPWVERLDEFPAGGAVDLTRLVDYPPRLRPVPVKPIFLDVAWNYVGYPGQEGGRGAAAEAKAALPVREADKGAEGEKAPKKSGWFGFGR